MDYVKVLAENLIPPLMIILSGLLVYGARRLLQLAEQKLGFDLDEASEKKLADLVDQGVHYAEQWGLSKAKRPGADPASGSEKLDKAMEFIGAEVARMKLPELARDALVAKIEAAVGKNFNSGGGAA